MQTDSSESFFLVTTADESTWLENEKILFLGEWCRLYARKEKMVHWESKVLKYHWDDRNVFFNDYQYLKKLHERLLEDLVIQLNKIHNVNFSIRYWRILIGPWLGYFTQILYDRWLSVLNAEKEYELGKTIIYNFTEIELVPNDMNEFLGFIKSSDDWNHFLYAEIITNYTKIKCIYKSKSKVKINEKSVPKISYKSKLAHKIFQVITCVRHFFFKQEKALFLVITYLPFLTELKLLGRFCQFPYLGTFPPPPKFKLSSAKRDWILDGLNNNDFESFVRIMIPRQIPKAYLEGYSEFIKYTESLCLPVSPKLIWTSNSHSADDTFKIWAAKKVEYKAKLVIGQHGGHYGIGLFSFFEDHELAICDSYLSWGWSDKTNNKIKPVGQIKRITKLNRKSKNRDGILLVTNMVPRNSYALYSSTIATQWLSYQNDQYRFVECLPELLQQALTVRLIPWDWGWDQAGRWEDRFPTIKINRGFTKIDKLINNSRIYIATYNATTFLESFNTNIPTIIFWDPNYWELRESAVPFFDELKRVKIFHETPESAANMVAEIWDDVDTWWNSKEVVEVVNLFKKEYCDSSNKLVDKLESTLQQVMSDNVENEQAQCR